MYWEDMGDISSAEPRKAAPAASDSTEAYLPAAKRPALLASAAPCSAAARFLTPEALAREPHSLRSLAPLLQVPGMIWLAGGTPHGSSFPLKSIRLTLTDEREFELSAAEARPWRRPCLLPSLQTQVYSCQQYMMTDSGYPPLVEWVEKHVRALHAPPRPVSHLLTCGNTNGLDIALRTLLTRGDVVLCEEFTYAATLQAMRPMGLKVLGIPCDAHGPCLASLRRCLAQRRASGAAPVRLFYCVPVSANPTGVTWSAERKAAVYALACEFDFLLLEDDAYYYLQFDRTPNATQPGLSGLGRSLLSLDVEERVVRCDSLSKFVAPGLRLGWLTAPPDIHARLSRYMMASVQGASSLSQVVVGRLLADWGEEGLSRHLCGLQASYARRSAALLAAARRHLGDGEGGLGGGGGAGAGGCGGAAPPPPLAAWSAPSAGMFLWLRLAGVDDSEALQPALKEFKVAAVPGMHFHCGAARGPYLRLSFASASEQEMDAGMERLARLLRSLQACS